MAKYMLIMRPTDESFANFMQHDYAEILDSPNPVIVVDFSGETPVVTDCPYSKTRELLSGYYILDVASQQEAVEWAKRAPLMAGSKTEIRRLTTIDEFPQDNE